MFNIGQQVQCKNTGLIGFIEDKEWEHGWCYTIKKENDQFFYRSEEELVCVD